MKVLHLATPQAFTRPYFDLLEVEFDVADHFILSRAKNNEWQDGLKIESRASDGLKWVLDFLRNSYRAKKIVLHGLWDPYLIILLFVQPWLLKKCYWMIWGGDLYSYRSSNKGLKQRVKCFLKRPVMKRMGHLVTYIKEDVELAREWFGAKGLYHECLMYTSNIYRPCPIKAVAREGLNIQVGNSSDPSNDHLGAFEKLIPYKSGDISIYAPLAYGDRAYAQTVIRSGRELFGGKFIAITELMPLDEYNKFLAGVDVAIFNHRRQQAMGNIIALIGMGKKVYLRDDQTPFRFFQRLGIRVFSISDLTLEPIKDEDASRNLEIISEYFSRSTLIRQLEDIFEG